MERRQTVVKDMLKTLSKGFGAAAVSDPTQQDVLSNASGEETVRSARELNEIEFHKQRIAEL